MKKAKVIIFTWFFLIIFSAIHGSGIPESFELGTFFSFNFLNRSNYSEDNLLSEANFVLTNGHIISELGVTAEIILKNQMSLGLESVLTFSSKVKTSDPEVGDFAWTNTRRRVFGFLILGKQFKSMENFKFFGQIGLGIHYQLDNFTEYYISDKGRLFSIDMVDRPFGWSAFIGVKNKWYISKSLAFIFDMRYLYINSLKSESGLVIRFGVNFGFFRVSE